MNNSSVLIKESAIYQEPDVKKLKPSKAIFRMVIQTVDDVNQNHRMYPSPVMLKALEECRPRMKRKSFYGELDHPIITGKDTYDNIRQTTVLLKQVSHIIRDYEKRGNQIIAEMETASTPNGKILLGLIRDSSTVGMSMRGMAELDRKRNYYVIKDPLTIISYDSVSDPSHSAATINFNEVVFENRQLFVKSLITENTKNKTICIGDQCFLANHFDKLVEKKIIKFMSHWV